MKIALAGNPNCGKTTLFNALTGGNAKVGNWPGVTVERREGQLKGTSDVRIVDLPGIYSLSPYSPEEIVARKFIIESSPDVIINIVDSTNLERNLYLTTQLLETDIPVVVALNMSDAAAKTGITVDAAALGKILGVEVIAISALRRDGLKELTALALKSAKTTRKGVSILSDGVFAKGFEKAFEIAQVEKMSNPVFQASKLLEGDEIVSAHSKFADMKVEKARELVDLAPEFDGDMRAAIANERYKYIVDELSHAYKRTASTDAETLSDKVDGVLTSRIFGFPIFFAMMFLVFHMTFGEDFFYTSALGLSEEGIPSPGVWMLGQTEVLMGFISDAASAGLEAVHAADWVMGLVVDGLLAGVGAILSFLPQIMMLFLFLSLMEDSGYMSRAAFLMDRVLRRFGLSGKAFMPMLMCFGCLVPAMMGTRTLESDKERKMAIMLAPFFSCGAKLPIWAMFSMALFPDCADTVIFLIYSLGILTAVVTALILKHTILRGGVSAFIMELPPYRLPTFLNVGLNMWEKLKSFILRASTIIAGATVIIWFLSSFNFSLEMVDTNSDDSIIGVLGSLLTPVFEPLGFASGNGAWKPIVAALTGLIAKEMVVSTLGVLYNPTVEGDALEDDAAITALTAALVTVFSPLGAVSFMAFNLLSVPCMAAVATAHSELRSAKWTWITIGFWIATAWVVSFLIWQIGSLLGLGVK